MKKVLLSIVVATALIILGTWLIRRALIPEKLKSFDQGMVKWDSHEVVVAVARTKSEQETGLGEIDFLPESYGMLFVFEKQALWGIWMKDMTIPIDIIWIREDGTVVTVRRNISPDTYPVSFTPTEPALYVLELASGVADKTNLKAGDKVSFELPTER